MIEYEGLRRTRCAAARCSRRGCSWTSRAITHGSGTSCGSSRIARTRRSSHSSGCRRMPRTSARGGQRTVPCGRASNRSERLPPTGPSITVARAPPAQGAVSVRAAECGAHEQASAQLERLYGMVRACVPAGLEPDPLPRDFADTDAELVEPAWRRFAVPINRYLAARAFASWISWQARGVVTAVAALWAARAVLRVEAGRQCRAAGRMLDAALLVEAIRQADLLLVHKTSSRALADRLAAVEQGR